MAKLGQLMEQRWCRHLAIDADEIVSSQPSAAPHIGHHRASQHAAAQQLCMQRPACLVQLPALSPCMCRKQEASVLTRVPTDSGWRPASLPQVHISTVQA